VRDGERIDRLPRPSGRSMGGAIRRDWAGGRFVDLHSEWQERSGHAALFTTVEIAEDMGVELLTGYDGPFRLWVDVKEVHRDLHGTNPAIADRVRVPLRLRKGRHRITVLMALNHGKAWGFFLRFVRSDLPSAVIDSGAYHLPIARR
nr:sialate O-acetylesterase [Planctomycetota bacterium]